MNEERLFNGPADSAYNSNRTHFIVIIIGVLASLIWGLITCTVRLPSDTTLPPKPYTKADLPHLKRNLKALHEDAALLTQKLSRLDHTANGRVAAKLWEEVFYTPEHYSAFVKNRNIEMAHVLELQPGLAKFINLTREYQDARSSIAANSALADKTAAIAELDKRLQPQLKYPEYSHDQKTFDAARRELFGNAEFDQAREAYRRTWEQLALKRHPELGEYFHLGDVYDAAYAHLMSKANTLALDINTLENSPSTARQ